MYILGDCNQDGVVGLLDIAPIIDVFRGAEPYLVEADCNEDGAVSFSDIFPFVEILTAN